MRSSSICILTVTISLAWQLAAAPAKEESIGDKVVAFCQQHIGEEVGNGECSSLASHALKAAGAKARGGKDAPSSGDYVWGTQVLFWESAAGGPKGEGKPADVHPGDIIQFRDAKWVHKEGKRTSTQSMGHHTAVVASVDEGGVVIHILQQNTGGKKIVSAATLHLADLKEGWIRIYQPIADSKAGK